MLGRTSSSSFLVLGSLCGVYSRGSSFFIFLKSSSQRGYSILAPILASVSPKYGSWTKGSLVILLMTDTSLGQNSNCLATNGEEPSPTFYYYILVALGNFPVEGFFGGIVPAI
jgi:hypothetical protein